MLESQSPTFVKSRAVKEPLRAVHVWPKFDESMTTSQRVGTSIFCPLTSHGLSVPLSPACSLSFKDGFTIIPRPSGKNNV